SGPAGEVRQHDDLTAPARHCTRLGKVVDRVVATLGKQVRPQAFERGDRRVAVEHLYRVDAVERLQHGGAVTCGLEGTVGTLQTTDRRVGIEQHDEAIAEATRGLQRCDVTGVQEVETPAGRD